MNDSRLPRKFGRHRFTALVVLSTLLGILVGMGCHRFLSLAAAERIAGYFSIVTAAFLRLIGMVIAPLVFATLTTAVARMGGATDIGRVGAKALLWFVAASCVSLTIGLSMAHAMQPGAALHDSGLLAGAPALHNPSLPAPQPSLEDFVAHLIPRSFVAAMADNEILQVVMFSLLLGAAAASLKEKAARVVALTEQLSDVMFQVTNYIMMLAPLAIFSALAGSIARYGAGIVQTYAKFVAGFYISLALLWIALFAALAMLAGSGALRLAARIRQPAILAFATSSSEAAYPRLLEELAAFGVPRRTAAFVLPLGYSFNLDGAMMYCSFAVLFIAQAYGVPLSLGQQATLFGLLFLTTKGLAGVPRAAIAVIAVTLPKFHLPDAGIALVLAVDHVLDMGRSATNIVGNAVAAVAVATWEGQLDIEPTRDAL